MQNKIRIWVLGAADPEMELIERLLRESGESVVYATGEDGRRVHPGNAYRCPVPSVPEGATVYAVECIDQLPEGWIRIDHHRPGDPGYGRPPSEFMRASSIGQVISALARSGALASVVRHNLVSWIVDARDMPVPDYNRGIVTLWFWTSNHMPSWPHSEPGMIERGVSWLFDGYAVDVGGRHYLEDSVALIPRHIMLAAAADHCLAAAYRGECPGVDPDELMAWRAETRADFQGRPAEDVLADVERARVALREAPRIDLGAGVSVCDMRGDRGVAELPEAAVREGMAYLASVTDRDGRQKVVLGGHSTPETVREFMVKWAPAQGLVDIYGDPARGFAGGYLPQHDEEAATS